VRALFDAAIGDLKVRCAAEESSSTSNSSASATSKRRGRRAPSYGELAKESCLPVTQVTNLLAWARRALREAVLARLRALCASEQEFRDEARALLGFTPDSRER